MKKQMNFAFSSPFILGELTILSLLLLIATGFSSCRTTPKSASVVGRVILSNDTGDPSLDPVDYSGVTVALYDLADLDTTLVRINGQYPQIGVLISQETEFDHRSAQQIKSVFSNPDGSFALSGIDSGVYNVVILKDQWGVKYLYNVEISSGNEVNLGDITMFPVLEYSSTIIDNVIFRSDHCYLITENVNFIGSVEIEPRAIIFIDPGVMAKFYGGVATPSDGEMDEAWKFLPSKEIYSPSQYELTLDDYYNSVAFYGNSVEINNGLLQYFVNSIVFNCDQSQMSNMLIRYFDGGIAVSEGNATLQNLLVANGIDYGINISSTSSGESQITDSIIMKTTQGLDLTTLSTYSIHNCYFFDNRWAMRISYSNGSITNSCFDENVFGIYTSNVATPTQIDHNNFYYTHQYCIVPCHTAVINNNNFYRTNGYFIKIWSPDLFNNSYVWDDIDATNNYWGVSNLDDYLLDGNDNDEHADDPCPYYIIYQPRRNDPVPDAGIQ